MGDRRDVGHVPNGRDRPIARVAGGDRFLGAVVRAVPGARAGARETRRGEVRRVSPRQGEHGREPRYRPGLSGEWHPRGVRHPRRQAREPVRRSTARRRGAKVPGGPRADRVRERAGPGEGTREPRSEGRARRVSATLRRSAGRSRGAGRAGPRAACHRRQRSGDRIAARAGGCRRTGRRSGAVANCHEVAFRAARRLGPGEGEGRGTIRRSAPAIGPRWRRGASTCRRWTSC